MFIEVVDNQDLLKHDIRGHKIWAYRYDTETKAQLSESKLPEKSKPNTACQVRLNEILLLVVFDYNCIV